MSNQTPNMTTARRLFKAALADSIRQLGLQDADGAARFFRQGHCDQCGVLRHNLARRIGDYLATKDPNLRAVYIYDPDSACDVYGNGHRASSPSSALNLVVWTRTTKRGISTILRALREALGRARAEVLCPQATALCYSLQAAIVNDLDVRERRGYAAMVRFLTVRPTPVWEYTTRRPKRS